jgi:hypothetical protein
MCTKSIRDLKAQDGAAQLSLKGMTSDQMLHGGFFVVILVVPVIAT